MAKKRVNITITEETQERILQYAYENHLQGGLSGAIEHIAWQVLKVKNAQLQAVFLAHITGKLRLYGFHFGFREDCLC